MAARREAVAKVTLDPKIEEKLVRLFRQPVIDGAKADREIERLARKHGEAIYPSLLFLLAHLEFKGRDARKQWKEIVAHHAALRREIGRPLDLRVALLDYFISQNKKLRNPKILELELYQLARREAISDELTKLYNFRHFEASLDRELKRAARYTEPLSLLLFDIDDFKFYNDKNGHLAGNQVLRRISRILTQSVRQIDIVARYGGEEFAVLLPATTKQGALLTAERIRQAIDRQAFPFGEKQPRRKVTVSGGLATYPVDAKGGRDLIERADTALYRAKSDGKNNIKAYLTETRSFARVDARMVGAFSVLPHRTIKISTRDLSKNGILFEADESVAIGSLLDMRIKLSKGAAVRLRTQVVRVERLPGKRFDIGVTIVQMSAADRKRLETHIDKLLDGA
ncbi:MAG: diguanylate cyclase [Bdellovibrionota bacterium]